MHNPGCVGPDSNRKSPAYEAGELPISLPRNIQGGIFFRSEPPRPHMKGNENRISGWHSGRLWLVRVHDPY